jgi:predicted RNA-binding Zn-ribbon protein involved in translation (DUF1610 family)
MSNKLKEKYMGKKKEKITPSQQRYNQKKPSTTFRIDSETVKKLYELFEASNAGTWGIFFKGLVGNYKLQLISLEDARKAGYESGYSDARFRFAVSFPCPDCGHTIFINTPELKTGVRKLIANAGWIHSECPEPDLPRPTPPKPVPANMSRPRPNPPVGPAAKSNGSQDKIRLFLKEQPSKENRLNSDPNNKNPTGS